MGRGGRYETLIWAPDFTRRSGRREAAGEYQAFIPDPIAEYEPLLSSPTQALSERASAAIRDLNASSADLVSLEGMGRQLLRAEALASSQIEGLNISHKKLAESELEGRAGHHKAAEIMGTVRAMEHAMEIGASADELTIKHFTEIHKQLATVPPLDRIAGQIREEPSWIGGMAPPDADFVGPPHEYVRLLLGDLCQFMNRDDVSPIPQAALAHAQFETIHPFGDGNGRVGRCLIHVLFRRRGIAPNYVPPVSLVLGANKDAYIAGLESYRRDQDDGWVAQFARSTETAANKAASFSSQVAELQKTWKGKLGSIRSDSAVHPLIELLPRYPIITAAVAEKETSRSRQGVITGLAQLEQAGILTRHRNQKKGDSWEAKELFELLNQFERSVRL